MYFILSINKINALAAALKAFNVIKNSERPVGSLYVKIEQS